MIRFGLPLPALALVLLPAVAAEPAAACSVVVGREPSPAAKMRDARLRIERSTAIVDGEVVRPLRRGIEPALVRAYHVLKGPRQEVFAVGERHGCDTALTEIGQRQRMILDGGPEIYYLGLDTSDGRDEDRLLRSDRRKVWPFRRGGGPADPPPIGPPPAGEAAPGLWVGSIRLCRDNVEAVETAAEPSGGPATAFSFKPAMQPRLAEQTRALVGKPMPIRLDGVVISEPEVREPVTGLGLHVSGGLGDLRAVRSAALGACAQGADPVP